jgi:hypothetical protein
VKLADLLPEIEKLVVHGSLGAAAEALRGLSARRIPREHASHFASLSRRTGQPALALNALHKIVRPLEKRGRDEPATDREKSEYAAALNDVGASREALALLSGLDHKKAPSARLYEGFALMRIWELDAAIERFRAVAGSPAATPLGRYRATIELAGCLIDGPGKLAEAKDLLLKVREETGPGHFRMIHKDAFLVLTQAYLQSREWAQAARSLDRLEALSREENDQFFLLLTRKWRAILAIETARDKSRVLSELGEVRDALRAARRWEDARLCHYYEAAARGSRELFLHLYFGTPYPAFRAKLEKGLGRAPLPGIYEWRLSSREKRTRSASAPLFDMSATLAEGALPQRLLRAICLDLYRPARVTELHELLFPGEYFNPHSSPDRVHQNLKRLRAWLRKMRAPLGVTEWDGFYGLASPEGCIVRLNDLTFEQWFAADGETARLQTAVARLRAKRGSSPFSATEAASDLEMSERSALRLLGEAVAGGFLEKTGKGRATRYRVTS